MFSKAVISGDIGLISSDTRRKKISLEEFANALYYAEVIIKTTSEENEFNGIKRQLKTYIDSINKLDKPTGVGRR